MRILRSTGVADLFEHVSMQLRPGARVRLHGLGAKPELNGREGTAVRVLLAQVTRWEVRLDGPDKPIVAVRQSNLEILGSQPERASSASENTEAAAAEDRSRGGVCAHRNGESGIVYQVVRFVR